MIYTEFSKAFESINYGALQYAHERLGVGDPFLLWSGSYLNGHRRFVSLFGKSFDLFHVSFVVLQDSHLDSILFIIFINIIYLVVFICRIFLFADDSKIFHMISSHNDCLILQNTLDKFIT